MHRVPVGGDRGREPSGAYTAYLAGHPAGFIQNFRTGAKVNWKASGPPKRLAQRHAWRSEDQLVQVLTVLRIDRQA